MDSHKVDVPTVMITVCVAVTPPIVLEPPPRETFDHHDVIDSVFPLGFQ
jgi:hypothetical protein